MAAVAALGGGCRGADTPLTAEDRQFIDTMVALREAAARSGDDAGAYEAMKAQVLSERGVTEEQLRAYIEVNARDLDRLAAVWDSINLRLSTPPAAPQ